MNTMHISRRRRRLKDNMGLSFNGRTPRNGRGDEVSTTSKPSNMHP